MPHEIEGNGTHALTSQDVVTGAPVVGAAVLQESGGEDTIVSYGNVTWTLDGTHDVKHFVNGEPYVVGSSVTVKSVSPETQTIDGHRRNGSVINPTNGAPFDSRAGVGYVAELEVQYPVTITADSSLASSISVTSGSYSWVAEVQVLTILTTAPDAGRTPFRPALVGAIKTPLIYEDQIQWGSLPTVNHGSATLPTPATIESTYTNRYRAPWILCIGGYAEWYQANRQAQLDGYHQNIARNLSHGAAFAVTNFEGGATINEQPGRRALVKGLIQVGIEYYQMQLQTSVAPRATYFLPSTFAGAMLGDNAMRDYFKTGPRYPDYANRNNLNTYYSHKRYAGGSGTATLSTELPKTSPTSVSLGGSTPYGQDTWTGYYARTGRKPVFCGFQLSNFEELHPLEWSTGSITNNQGSAHTYRRQHSPYTVGMLIVAWALGDIRTPGKNLYNEDTFAEYAVRWMYETDSIVMDSFNQAEYGCTITGYTTQGDPMYYDRFFPPGYAVCGGASAHSYCTSGNNTVDALWQQLESAIVAEVHPS
jgi:hypothetical protein